MVQIWYYIRLVSYRDLSSQNRITLHTAINSSRCQTNHLDMKILLLLILQIKLVLKIVSNSYLMYWKSFKTCLNMHSDQDRHFTQKLLTEKIHCLKQVLTETTYISVQWVLVISIQLKIPIDYTNSWFLKKYWLRYI